MRPLAIALAVLAASAAPAHGELPPELIGTTDFNDPSPDDFALMAKAVGTYRTNLYWPAVEPTQPGARDWSRYDALIAGAAEEGIRVLPTIYGSPTWAAARPQYPPDPDHLDEFGRFLEAAVERYGRGGEFWAAHPELPPLPIRSWQLWNEQNNSLFWLPNPDASQYTPLLVAASAATRRAGPPAQVVLGGLFRTPYAKNGVPMRRYLSDLYDGGAAPYFDAVAVHPYAKDPGTAFRIVEEAREVMDSHGDAEAPIWITEIGWATSGDPSTVTVPEEVQAEYLREVLRLAEANRERLRLAGVIWFSFQDQEPSGWPNRTGLLRADGEPKPAWDALTAVTDGAWLNAFVEAVREFAARITETATR